MKIASTDIQSQSDVLDPQRAAALLAALDRDEELNVGDTLPPFFHHIYFWDAQPPGALGRDGHPKVGGLIPDLGLPRRMWAGGHLEFNNPIRLGQSAEKRSICERIEEKTGRSGLLGFVTLRHEYWQDGHLCLTEWQDLVYREDPAEGGDKPMPPIARTDALERHELRFDTTTLFRYSALTFNGHRIHYDGDYARSVEGYNGIVVHGPLLAQILMLMATDMTGPLTTFQFRATAPLIVGETAQFCRSGSELWVRGPSDRLCMTATI
ncbi:MAG: acyl dehydratase [Pseudomonadota bacterium]